MSETYQDMKLNINGLEVDARYTKEDIDHIFYPLLKRFKELQIKLNRRIVVFIAAAPGTGKSTLVSFLELLSRQDSELLPVQAIGIDGFHYPNDYLNTHHIDNNKNNPVLKTIKGAPSTFDVHKLSSLLKDIQNDIQFPIYSRVLHNPIENGITVKEKIILLEGNYLLLDQHPWNQLTEYADYTIFIEADEKVLEERLIQRKQAGGSSTEEAIRHYMNSDKLNVELVLNHSKKADMTIMLDKKMNYRIL